MLREVVQYLWKYYKRKISCEILRPFHFRTATKYCYQEEQENAKCCNCGKRHDWDCYEGSVYLGKLLCPDCYQDYYGYCNVCGELHLYSDLNSNHVCKGCEKLLSMKG